VPRKSQRLALSNAIKPSHHPSSFINRRGERIQSIAISATDAKNEFARALETALRGGLVVITKHENPKAVLLSIDDFQALSQPTQTKLDALSAEFDALLDRMQTREAGDAMKAAFAATPEELGRTARKAARRRA
jgi:antitoxin Phd